MGKIEELYAAASVLLTNLIDSEDHLADVDEEEAVRRGYHPDGNGRYWHHDAWNLNEALDAVTEEDARRADEGLDWVNNLHDYYASKGVPSGHATEVAVGDMIRENRRQSDPPRWIKSITEVHHAMMPRGIVHWDDVDRLLGRLQVKLWVVYGSYDWYEFSHVFFSEEEANAKAMELFEVDSMEDIDEAYERGKWKAFSIDTYTYTLSELFEHVAAQQNQQPTTEVNHGQAN